MKKIIPLLLIVPLLIACVELPRDCADCQEAIDQMVEGMTSYGCDPYNYQGEWDLMDVECGVMTDTYIGFIAETCELGEVLSPLCGYEPSLVLRKAYFTYYTSTGLPEPVEVIVQSIYGSDNFVFYDTDHNILTGPYDTIRLYPKHLVEGTELTFNLYKGNTDEKLATEEITFTFERSQFNWAYQRQVLINYTEESGHTIKFASWWVND